MDFNVKNEVNITLTPYQAMQIIRWTEYIFDAINDPLLTKEVRFDREGIMDAVAEINRQVYGNITDEQLQDACATRDVKKLMSGN